MTDDMALTRTADARADARAEVSPPPRAERITYTPTSFDEPIRFTQPARTLLMTIGAMSGPDPAVKFFGKSSDPLVTISLIDGSVTLSGDPDEAAKVFWAAVTRNFPGR